MSKLDASNITKVRGQEYGPAWLTTNNIVQELGTQNLNNLVRAGFFFNWVMILNKLVRAMVTPNNRDHWLDIIGYAQLSLDHLDAPKEAPIPGLMETLSRVDYTWGEDGP
jgi:hypothetical protein